MIQADHPLAVTRRCTLLEVARSTVYYRPTGISAEDLTLMRRLDEIHLERPFYGSRRLRDELETQGHPMNRKRVQRLMRQMGLRALVYRGAQAHLEHQAQDALATHRVPLGLVARARRRRLSIERTESKWISSKRRIKVRSSADIPDGARVIHRRFGGHLDGLRTQRRVTGQRRGRLESSLRQSTHLCRPSPRGQKKRFTIATDRPEITDVSWRNGVVVPNPVAGGAVPLGSGWPVAGRRQGLLDRRRMRHRLLSPCRSQKGRGDE